MRIVSTLAMVFVAAATLAAQTGNRRVTQNEQSPSADTSVALGGNKMTVEYNAPSARGRNVEGGLIPYTSVWRFGADSATTLTATADLMIGDLKVPKGVYTLYIQASESGWKLIVNKQTKQWGTVYSASEDLGRVALKLTKLSVPVEKLEILLHGSGSAGSLEFSWGGTKASVAVKLA